MADLWDICFGGDRKELLRVFRKVHDKKHTLVMKRPGDPTIAGQIFWQDCLFRGKKVAYLCSLGIDPDLRRQGLGTELMEYTLSHLKAQGYSAAVLEPQDDELFWFYHYFGFRLSGTHDAYFKKAGEPVEMWEITPEEYHRLRPEYLPEEGLELPLVFFREHSREFAYYQGEDFICTIEHGELYNCRELLGNRRAAGGIVANLGKPHLFFRTPGKDHNDVMLLDFEGCLPEDIYLGFFRE